MGGERFPGKFSRVVHHTRVRGERRGWGGGMEARRGCGRGLPSIAIVLLYSQPVVQSVKLLKFCPIYSCRSSVRFPVTCFFFASNPNEIVVKRFLIRVKRNTIFFFIGTQNSSLHAVELCVFVFNCLDVTDCCSTPCFRHARRAHPPGSHSPYTACGYCKTSCERCYTVASANTRDF